MADFDTNPLEIHYWDDPVLSVVCAPLDDSEFDSRLLDFGQRLIQIMKDKKGVGLAASQVGVCKRVFAMTEEDGTITVGCNPTLSPSKNIVYHKEGCLSVPGVYEVVGRSNEAIIRYFTLERVEVERELVDLQARIAQHEVDHLDGIMFFDRSRVSKQVSKSVERAWEKQRIKLGL